MFATILDHIEFIGFCLILFEVFSMLITAIFGIIQIPFALIGRPAVYIVLLFRTYLLSLFAAVCVFIASHNGLTVIPFIVIFVIVLFGEFMEPFSNNQTDSSNQNYIFFSAILSIIIFFVLYLTNYFPLIQIPMFFFSAASWLLSLPVIGSILNFLLPFISVVTGVWVIIHAIILVSAFASIYTQRSTSDT